MKLSIITINRNNAEGLRKTLGSVANQTCKDFEHIIIDGASTDDSVEVIKRYENSVLNSSPVTHHQIKWISEPDKGIYNAMNKGIRMASGEYVQFLNSGDCLANDKVVERMLQEIKENHVPDLIYGNMIKIGEDGEFVGKSGYVECTLLQFYLATLNHDCAFVKKSLFDVYGLYDENLKIVSDWKWYLQAIGLGKVKPIYVDIDVTIFDANGISESDMTSRNKERRKVIEEVFPPAVLSDYDKHAFDMVQMDRLRRRHLYKLVYFMERSLFKLEKWHILK